MLIKKKIRLIREWERQRKESRTGFRKMKSLKWLLRNKVNKGKKH